jgi:hypothetical protein
MTTLVIIAKEPIAGRVKTRLHPPLSLEQAATLAAASIDDTILAMDALPATRRILAFDGDRVPRSAAGYEILPQTEGGLDERLGAIFDACDGPTVLIGMDTPQVTADLLTPAFESWSHEVDAWFGPATDGGFWAIGMREPDGDLIRGIPMSRAHTGHLQLQRLHNSGLRTRLLRPLTDVDTIDTAFEVADLVPDSRFARTLAGFDVRVGASS